jgi:hypothetical protein
MADCPAFDGALAGLKTLLRKTAERTFKAKSSSQKSAQTTSETRVMRQIR